MSGGYLKDGLKLGDHQIVIFTFKGPIELPKCQNWNQEIDALKQIIGEKVIAVTLAGESTPQEFLQRFVSGGTTLAPPKGGRPASSKAKTARTKPAKKTARKAPRKARRRNGD